ncbi:MAG: methyltransferase domain-containing protein [Rikenellaceae bacterium]
MKRLIKFILNTLPRPLMQRMAGWAVPVMGLFYLGQGKRCPICGCERRKFLPYGYVVQRENALCPSCLSLERHRLLWLYLERETSLAKLRPTLLHIAPEVSLMNKFHKIYRGFPKRYITADLESPLAHLHFDVQQIPLDDNYADVLICNHLLEHVADDRRAMSEFYRILKPNGWGVLLSPVEYDRQETFEDDSITDPAERTRIFGQYDHRRIYGVDYAERLRQANFEVEEIRYYSHLSAEEQERYALMDETIYLVRSTKVCTRGGAIPARRRQ